MPSAVDGYPGFFRDVRQVRVRRLARSSPRWLAAALAAAPALAPAADFVWDSGDFVPGVTAPSPMPAGDTLTILSGGTKRFLGTSPGAVRRAQTEQAGERSGNPHRTGGVGGDRKIAHGGSHGSRRPA